MLFFCYFLLFFYSSFDILHSLVLLIHYTYTYTYTSSFPSSPLHTVASLLLSCLIPYLSALYSHTHSCTTCTLCLSLPLHIHHHTMTQASALGWLYHTAWLLCQCIGQWRRTLVILSNLQGGMVPSVCIMTNRRRTSNSCGFVGYNTHRLDRTTEMRLCHVYSVCTQPPVWYSKGTLQWNACERLVDS